MNVSAIPTTPTTGSPNRLQRSSSIEVRPIVRLKRQSLELNESPPLETTTGDTFDRHVVITRRQRSHSSFDLNSKKVYSAQLSKVRTTTHTVINQVINFSGNR